MEEEAALSEYVQFAAAMVLFIAILIGSYWFVVFGPNRSEGRRQRDEEGQ